jgi:hypothetical protein
MTMLSTSNQGVPYPDVNEPLNNVNDWLYAMAQYLETRGVARFATMAELSSKRPSPASGEVAWVFETHSVYVFDVNAWKRIYPPTPMVYSGTTTPSSSLGAVGDLYIKTA